MKIITFNVANYNDHPHWEERKRMIAQILVEQNPDITALQEIRFDPNEESTQNSYQNMAEQILEEISDTYLGEEFSDSKLVTTPAMYYPVSHGDQNPWEYPSKTTGKLWEGLSILAKNNMVLGTSSVFLSKGSICNDANRRATQMISVEANGGPLYFFNTHFGLDGPCLETNINETINFMDSFPEGYKLLVGDMNAEPNNRYLQALADAGYEDFWQKLRATEAGYTYPANSPDRRIDYCWGNKTLCDKGCTIDLIGNSPNSDGIYSSDHLGLALTLGI